MNDQIQLKSVSCDLCRSDQSRLLYQRENHQSKFEMVDAQMTTDVYSAYGRIVECKMCGLVYRNPQPLPDALISAYESMEDGDYTTEDDCRSINAHLSMKVIRRYKTNGRLLDVGCSTGYFLNAARMNFEPVGLELSKWAADHAKSQLKLDVKHGTLESVRFDLASFDVITLVDVIEHVISPKTTLTQLSTLLKSNGLIYLVTPDVNSLSAHLMRGHWWGFRPAHLVYFSKSTLTRLLKETGFRVVHVQSYGRIFTYGYWLSRLKNYPWVLYRCVKLFIDLFNLHDKVLYLNTRDSLEICAVKDTEN